MIDHLIAGTWLPELVRKIWYVVFRMPCLFHAMTGLYCPGCGGTRAVKYLFQGQVLMSLQYHPLVLYLAVVTGAEAVSWIMAKVCRKPNLYLGHGNIFLYLAVAITAVNWIVKNVLLLGFGVDLLKVPLL